MFGVASHLDTAAPGFPVVGDGGGGEGTPLMCLSQNNTGTIDAR